MTTLGEDDGEFDDDEWLTRHNAQIQNGLECFSLRARVCAFLHVCASMCLCLFLSLFVRWPWGMDLNQPSQRCHSSTSVCVYPRVKGRQKDRWQQNIHTSFLDQNIRHQCEFHHVAARSIVQLTTFGKICWGLFYEDERVKSIQNGKRCDVRSMRYVMMAASIHGRLQRALDKSTK
jgi:hypothetical protein